MNKIFYTIILSMAALVLGSGCATTIRSTTSVFHNMPETEAQKTFAFLPLDAQTSSIEYASYAARIGEHLREYGWKEVTDEESSADYFVVFRYRIDGGETVSGSVPIYGQTGGGTSYTTGTVSGSGGGFATYSDTTYTTPTFGQVGSMPYRRREYGRTLEVQIIDAEGSSEHQLKNVYEGIVVSRGSSGSISEVLPTMIKALFRDFPGESGKTQRHTLSPVR